MFKKIMKCIAFACAAATIISVAGCADTSWAVKVDNITVPVGVYISYLYMNREKVLTQAQSSSSSSAASSSILTVGSSSSSDKASSDPWSQKIDNINAYAWAMTNAMKSAKELAMAEEMCAKKNIKLTSNEKSGISSYAAQYLTYYTGLKSNNVSQASFERVLTYSYLLTPKLIDAYYGKSGETPVSDSDLLNYYTANFADVKQIYITTKDDSGNTFADTKLKEIEATVNSIYTQVSADKSKFSSLQTQYDQDTSDKDNPAGLIFPKNSSSYSTISDDVFSMKAGEVKKVQYSDGWRVLYRVPTDTSASIYNDTMKTEVLQTMKMDDLKTLIDNNLAKAKVVENKDTINRYNPKDLKDS